ncbi:hypothetical protein WJX74_006978 [Apatococcus lobatus]|uniref:Uncharacterized protein n=1 Tax=Apatococcus lobatus TaxID=904363 RepID=A0AAW1QVT7_9CHLO
MLCSVDFHPNHYEVSVCTAGQQAYRVWSTLDPLHRLSPEPELPNRFHLVCRSPQQHRNDRVVKHADLVARMGTRAEEPTPADPDQPMSMVPMMFIVDDRPEVHPLVLLISVLAQQHKWMYLRPIVHNEHHGDRRHGLIGVYR